MSADLTEGLAALVIELRSVEESTENLVQEQRAACEALQKAQAIFLEKTKKINKAHEVNALKTETLEEAIKKLLESKRITY